MKVLNYNKLWTEIKHFPDYIQSVHTLNEVQLDLISINENSLNVYKYLMGNYSKSHYLKLNNQSKEFIKTHTFKGYIINIIYKKNIMYQIDVILIRTDNQTNKEHRELIVLWSLI